MKVTSILLAAALVLSGTKASAQFSQVDEQRLDQQPGGGGGGIDDDGFGYLNPDDPEDLRIIVIAWAQSMEATYGLPPTASEKFENLSPELMAYYAQIIGDRQGWALNLRHVMADLRAPLPGDLHVNAIPSPVNASYPTNTGSYATLVADLISGGYIANTTQRCNQTKFADAYNAWFIAHEAIGAAEAACTIAGCDPTGVACAIACAIIETARIAIDLATIPVRLCEFHDSQVADAELEAIYANTKNAFTGMTSLETSISSAQTAITTNDNSNRATITTAISSAQTAIVNNDNSNRSTITTAITSAQTAITNNDNSNKTSIINNDNSNTTSIITSATTQFNSLLSAGAGDLAAVMTALTNTTNDVNNNTNTQATNILNQDMASRTAVITNDNSNRDTMIANDNSNRDAILANDNANRDTMIANDNANRDTILAQMAANQAALIALETELARASRVREIQHALGSAQCEPWMYLPASSPDGHLEEVITVVQSAIDSSRTMGSASAHDLDMAQRSLDKVQDALTAGAPMDASSLCQDLRQAYQKATPAGQQ